MYNRLQLESYITFIHFTSLNPSTHLAFVDFVMMYRKQRQLLEGKHVYKDSSVIFFLKIVGFK